MLPVDGDLAPIGFTPKGSQSDKVERGQKSKEELLEVFVDARCQRIMEL